MFIKQQDNRMNYFNYLLQMDVTYIFLHLAAFLGGFFIAKQGNKIRTLEEMYKILWQDMFDTAKDISSLRRDIHDIRSSCYECKKQDLKK
jgi:hypothetical protein